MRKLKGTVLTLVTVALVMVMLAGVALAAPPPHVMEKKMDGNTSGPLNRDGDGNAEDGEGWIPPGLREKGIPPGLQDKGGLPPGLQGREVLPPGIMMRFREALEGIDEDAPGLSIEGPEVFAIPDEESVGVDYTAVFFDGSEDSTVAADWSLEEEVTGVSLSSEGVLTVGSDATSGTLTIEAVYTVVVGEDEEEYVATLDVELYRPEMSELTIEGDEYVTFDDEDESLSSTYVAVARDQMGEEIPLSGVEWTFESEDLTKDVTEDGSELTVLLSAAPGTFTLTATGNGHEASLDVVVYQPSPAKLVIEGEEYVTLEDDQVGTDLTLSYSASVLDQEEQPIEGLEPIWSVSSESSGIAVKDGDVTIASLPEGDLTFTLSATYDDLSDEMLVVAYYPAATDIVLDGLTEVAIPVEGESTSETYTATVLDQKGREMEGVALNWLLVDAEELKIEPVGVELDSQGSLTVTSESESMTISVLCAVDDGVFESLEVSLF